MAIFNKTEMKAINRDAGYFDFTPGAMRYFRARIADRLYPVPHGVVFVESTQFEDTNGNRAQRRYTVKYMDERSGAVEKLTEFQEYSSRNGVHNRASVEQDRVRRMQR